ncbi:MAG: SDR family NAD(P)-dependent oxidoreductase [Blastocatellia bacterium]|nr:SDR family NAD(P)-dependent oxidoreductase [Blastocatellia bacterium]
MVTHTVHQFAEKVALVTDGADPVGKAVALQLALLGAFVTVGVRDSEDIQRTGLEEMMSLGTLAGVTVGDISTNERGSSLIDPVEERFGRLDLLVNCLEIGVGSTFSKIMERAVPLMKERPKARIVNFISNFSDAEAEDPLTEETRSFAETLGPNFKVNCVVSRTNFAAEVGSLVRAENALSPKDAASVVVFLLSSESKALNGQVLYVS